MKRIFAILAFAGLTATSAQAACSKASLNGLWTLDAGGTSLATSITNGAFYFTTNKFTISTLSGSTCRGTGNFLDVSGPTNYPAIFAVEASSRDANGKPNRLVAGYTTDSGVNYSVLVLTRR